ncbi:multicopper oxidase domain-containing protein [Klenkia terrae]|uniref:multicopper oxidase domain-containing protein n=1 Tax=Klenkia terrae TaxID=1052259 RepID=UPI0036198DFD
MLSYNGGLPGPTLYLQPGDRLQVRLTNDLDAPTNLHVHGLHVSPLDNGDNVFIAVQPGSPSTTTTSSPPTIPPACTGTTRTTTAWSPTRSSVASTARSSSATPSRCRRPASGCW